MYTDISNKELLFMCFWWIEDLRVQEDFVGYSELPDIKSDTIATAIKDSLIRIQLSVNDLRAQDYDGAGNIFGKSTDVSLQIAAEQPKALPTHCQGHSLNLRTKTTMTDSKQMNGVMGTIAKVISLVKHSPKRENLLGNIKNFIHFEFIHTDEEILLLDGQFVEKMVSDYLPLMKLWDVSLAAGKLDSEVKARIIEI